MLLTRRYLLALPLAVALAAVATGLPTDVLQNPWFTRMTRVTSTDLVLWVLTSLALGALLGTLALPRLGARPEASALGGGVLSTLAIGCPVCNKLVVLLLGLSGATTYFAPIQPLLGVAGLVIALVALRHRVRALTKSCELVPGGQAAV